MGKSLSMEFIHTLKQKSENYNFNLEIYTHIISGLADIFQSSTTVSKKQLSDMFSRIIATSGRDLLDIFFMQEKPVFDFDENDFWQFKDEDDFVLRSEISLFRTELVDLQDEILSYFGTKIHSDQLYVPVIPQVANNLFLSPDRAYSISDIESYIKQYGFMSLRLSNRKMLPEYIDKVHIAPHKNYHGTDVLMAHIKYLPHCSVFEEKLPLVLLGLPQNPVTQYPQIFTIPAGTKTIYTSDLVKLN